ncbi:unnamed protein product [Penicillium viridicatum]
MRSDLVAAVSAVLGTLAVRITVVAVVAVLSSALHGAATGPPGLAAAPASNPDVPQTPARNAPLTPRDQSHNIFTLVHMPGLPSRETTRAKAI